MQRLWQLLLTDTVFANPFYVGMISLGERGTWIGSHPPMVTREEFDRALHPPPARGPEAARVGVRLQGMVRCGTCGRYLTGPAPSSQREALRLRPLPDNHGSL